MEIFPCYPYWKRIAVGSKILGGGDGGNGAKDIFRVSGSEPGN